MKINVFRRVIALAFIYHALMHISRAVTCLQCFRNCWLFRTKLVSKINRKYTLRTNLFFSIFEKVWKFKYLILWIRLVFFAFQSFILISCEFRIFCFLSFLRRVLIFAFIIFRFFIYLFYPILIFNDISGPIIQNVNVDTSFIWILPELNLLLYELFYLTFRLLNLE